MLRPSSWHGWLTAWAAVCLVSGWLANCLNVQMVWWLMTDWLDYWMADLMTGWFDDCCISELMILGSWMTANTNAIQCVHLKCCSLALHLISCSQSHRAIPVQFISLSQSETIMVWSSFHWLKVEPPWCAVHFIDSKWNHTMLWIESPTTLWKTIHIHTVNWNKRVI